MLLLLAMDCGMLFGLCVAVGYWKALSGGGSPGDAVGCRMLFPLWLAVGFGTLFWLWLWQVVGYFVSGRKDILALVGGGLWHAILVFAGGGLWNATLVCLGCSEI